MTTVVDRIKVPANMLALPTMTALHSEIDQKYPNRVLMNVGLVICRYRRCLKITNGLCVPGDGGSHHECLFRLVVFRPFVDEVCLGTIVKSTPEGIQVSLGKFYHDIFIPAYWMLRPSKYSEKLGLWVWSPDYGNEDDEDRDGDENGDNEKDEGGDTTMKMEEDSLPTPTVKKECQTEQDGGEEKDTTETTGGSEEEEKEEGDHFEMEIGAEIRFKIKSIHFTQVQYTAKGVQATTTTAAHSQMIPTTKDSDKALSPENNSRSLRERSLSVEVSDMSNIPASMSIVASICEDGLGLTSWWMSGEEEEDGAEE